MPAFDTLHKNRLLSLIFSPLGRDQEEGAGCEILSIACWKPLAENAGRTYLFKNPLAIGKK